MLQRVLALALCSFSWYVKDGTAFLAGGVRLGSVGQDRANAIHAQRFEPCDTLSVWYGLGPMPGCNRQTVPSRSTQKQTYGKGSTPNTCLWDTFGEFEVSLLREVLELRTSFLLFCTRQGSADEPLGLHICTRLFDIDSCGMR